MSGGGQEGTHPSPAQLDRFLLGEMAPSEAALVVVHLLRGCAICRERMAPLASAVFASGPLAPPAQPQSSSEYDFPLFRAFAAARRYAESRALGSAPLRKRNKQFPKSVPDVAVSGLVENEDSRTLCEALLERCRSLRFSDPEGMILAASLAVRVSEWIDVRREGAGDFADLQARAWAELGNAYRLANELSSAESALARALDLSDRGTGDPSLLARVMDLTASLYTDKRRFSEAQRLLDWTHEIYQRQGDRHAAGRALISKGISARAALQPEEGLRFLAQGLRRIDAGRDSKLVFLAVQGLIGCLVDCGEITAAKALFETSRDLHALFGERFDVIRAYWLEGQIAAGLGEDENAEQLLRRAREGFEGAGLSYHAAVVSLDLAAVWLRQGRTPEIKDLVDETVAIFKARNIHREAIGALLLLKTALQKDRATAALLQAVAAELRQWEGTSARQSHVPG